MLRWIRSGGRCGASRISHDVRLRDFEKRNLLVELLVGGCEVLRGLRKDLNIRALLAIINWRLDLSITW